MIYWIIGAIFILCLIYGLYLNKKRLDKKISVIGQAAWLYATTYPEKWQESTYYGWSCERFELNNPDEVWEHREINDINVKKREHQRIVNFLNKHRKLKKKERNDKKAKELMNFALDEAKKKLEKIQKGG